MRHTCDYREPDWVAIGTAKLGVVGTCGKMCVCVCLFVIDKAIDFALTP